MNDAMLWWLLVGHAVGDFWAQNDGIAQRKHPWTNPMPAVPWWYWMGAHALMHGGLVTLATGSAGLGIAEAVAHFGIDVGKCAGRYSIHFDQALHLACKLLWWVLA